jgi:hypothetical protein
MPEPKGNRKPQNQRTESDQPADVQTDRKFSTLRVYTPRAEHVGQLAALRRKTIADLMEEPDIVDFIDHLILEEARKVVEAKRKK